MPSTPQNHIWNIDTPHPCYDLFIAAASTALNNLLDPFSRCLDVESAQRIADFRISPDVQVRVDILADRAENGLLSDDERTEHESLINAADVLSILKLKAGRPEFGTPFRLSDATPRQGAGTGWKPL